MAIKNAVGRPPKFNMKIVNKLSDSISHNYSVSDACKHARIGRSTYYCYLKTEPYFADKMATAKDMQNKVNFNFRTTY
ncbi:MAG TPA: hypothetical protein VIH90_01780 [Candidatus Saccharimonadales bacterium]